MRGPFGKPRSAKSLSFMMPSVSKSTSGILALPRLGARLVQRVLCRIKRSHEGFQVGTGREELGGRSASSVQGKRASAGGLRLDERLPIRPRGTSKRGGPLPRRTPPGTCPSGAGATSGPPWQDESKRRQFSRATHVQANYIEIRPHALIRCSQSPPVCPRASLDCDGTAASVGALTCAYHSFNRRSKLQTTTIHRKTTAALRSSPQAWHVSEDCRTS